MNKFIKLSLIVYSLWFLVFGLGSIAQQELPPYPTGFWIMGQLDGSLVGLSGEALDGFSVIFYKNSGQPWAAFAKGVTYGGGKFLINAMDDLRLLPLTVGTYYVEVGKKEIKGIHYGKSETALSLDQSDLDNCFKKIGTLTLVTSEGGWEPGPLEIVTTTLPDGTVGQPYIATLEATGGTPPFRWRVVPGAGNLPPGLSLDGLTGVISGTPTTVGTYTFRIRVTDTAPTPSTAEKDLTIHVVYSIADISYGPQIRISVLYQALTNITDFSHSRPQYVRVEARTGAGPNTATTLVGYADVVLNEAGNTTGRNGFLRPNGTEFDDPTTPDKEHMPDGDYYLVVKQWLAPNLVGVGHLSVITNRKISLVTGVDRDASTTRLDLTNDPTITDNPVSRVYKETPYAPLGKPPALFTLPGGTNRTVMRAGDMDGNQYIDVVDTSHWYRLYTRYNTGVPDDPTDPYIRADLDQNGYVDVVDTSWWYGSFYNLSYELGDPGPHGYVPSIIP